MKTPKLIAGVLLVFIVGALSGALGSRIFMKHRYLPLSANPKERSAFIMKKLSKELRLSADQERAVQNDVEQMAERLHQHFLQMRPEMKKIINEGFEHMKETLNETQKKKLDSLREKFERHRLGSERR